MNVYQMKQRAFALVDKMYNDGADEATITYHVQSQFGFSKKLVKERIEAINAYITKE